MREFALIRLSITSAQHVRLDNPFLSILGINRNQISGALPPISVFQLPLCRTFKKTLKCEIYLYLMLPYLSWFCLVNHH